MTDEPRKAYLLTYKIVNQMEALVYADSADDARTRFAAGEGDVENTLMDYRTGGVRVRRWPDGDKDENGDVR